MSDVNQPEQPTVDLATVSAELRQVIEFDEVPGSDALHGNVNPRSFRRSGS